MTEQGSPPMWSELVIGSNRLINASGIIQVLGKPQVHLERGEEDNQLLLTMDIYSESGVHVARLRRNAWAFHGEDYEVTTSPESLTLIERATGTMVAEAQVHSRDKIEIPHADFFAATGMPILVEPKMLRVGSITMRENYFEGMNSMLRIEQTSVSIG